MDESLRNRLAELPPVNDLLALSEIVALSEEHGPDVVRGWVREVLGELRESILLGHHPSTNSTVEPSDRRTFLAEAAERVRERARARDRNGIARVINATGVILHTGLGRAPLAAAAVAALSDVAAATNLEIDGETGERRSRGYQLDRLWQSLTSAPAALVVNNNAGATLLALQGLCGGREVILSRGQLIEIGGSFRLPEIFELSGAKLREVGTTNHTRLDDYARAIGPETAAILRVHPSNYRVVGFSATPEIAALRELAHAHGLLAIDDIGSGALMDMTQLGLPPEPTFQDSLNAGVDIVLGSGDKLLGGPQCGILLGREELISQLKRHPLARALRIDKVTLAALAATLELYERGSALTDVPTLSLMAASRESLQTRADAILAELGDLQNLQVTLETSTAPVGGGSLPLAELPTVVLALTHQVHSADWLTRSLRLGSIRVYGRIQQERVLLDMRSVLPDDDARLGIAIRLADRES